VTLDLQLFYLLNDLAGKSYIGDGIIVFLAEYLAYVLIVVFVAFLFFSDSPRRKKLELFFVALLSSVVARFGVTESIRFFYHHPRPFTVLPVHQLLSENSWSFPSGHATFFFALATVLFLYDKKWGIGFFIAAILMTVSRVIAGIHYPSDIVGGAVIGISVGYATVYVARWIATRDMSDSPDFDPKINSGKIEI
jgi:undecaprenyl-diphosphatase